MQPNAFLNKPVAPSDAELSAAIGKFKVLWDRLLSDLAADGLTTSWGWHCYSRKAGWSVRANRDERTILYLAPYRGGFRVSFALGGKAIEAVRAAKFPKHVMDVIDAAPKYAEGFGIRLDVKGPKDLPSIKKLAAIKVQH
jgi:hypothetical protein